MCVEERDGSRTVLKPPGVGIELGQGLTDDRQREHDPEEDCQPRREGFGDEVWLTRSQGRHERFGCKVDESVEQGIIYQRLDRNVGR